ncbi:uncharacterized protein Dana_GF22209 [Drosophila ananassae]|uniref:MADF domain-containing protein n=1 Tax=Drosophila ananassae TaxID=7217 RepID=B3MYU4_DROAN|nr:vacuolar protein sorting-associated protein 13-like protein [Drosophila ananassae]EDV32788.1 uncharacterized protein Dana_GF22209 [Drosophila ananassae]
MSCAQEEIVPHQGYWNVDQTLKLIRAYQDQELLWNRENLSFGHRAARTEAWMRIAAEMQAHVIEVKKKMNSMIHSHRLHKKRGTISRTWWATHLSFLSPPSQHSISRSNNNNNKKNCNSNENESDKTKGGFSENSYGSFSDKDFEDIGSDCEFVQDNPQKRSAFVEFLSEFESPSKKATKNGDIPDDNPVQDLTEEAGEEEGPPDDSEEDEEDKAAPFLQPDTTDKDPEHNDTEYYMKYVACKLRNYTPRIRSMVQFQINKIIYQADMQIFHQN